MTDILVPTADEVHQWLLDTVKHALHIEYFLHQLGLGDKDPERPHDIVGKGNKFEWEVIKGFALQYRQPKVNFQIHIMPALERHRIQYHHQKWNNPDPNDETKYISHATPDDMKVGATDAICSLLENREYQGGTHTYDTIVEVAGENNPHKTPWMLEIIPEMRKLQQPNLSLITNLERFPKIGVPNETYDIIADRIQETLKMLRSDPAYRELK